jgi:hypothetical protein
MTTPTYPDVPKSGIFKITVDNSPFPLEGKTFSYSQIMLALQGGTFRPGMKFRHMENRRAEYVLTASGLRPLPKKQNSRAVAEEVDDAEEMD